MLVSELAQVKGSDFEAVDVSSLMVDSDSGLAVQGCRWGRGLQAITVDRVAAARVAVAAAEAALSQSFWGKNEHLYFQQTG